MNMFSRFHFLSYSFSFSITGLFLIFMNEFSHYEYECNIEVVVRDFESLRPIDGATITLKGERLALTKENGEAIININSNKLNTFTASKMDEDYIPGDEDGDCSSGRDNIVFYLLSESGIERKEFTVDSLIKKREYEKASQEIQRIEMHYPELNNNAFQKLRELDQKIELKLKEVPRSSNRNDLINDNDENIRYNGMDEIKFKEVIKTLEYGELEKLLKENKQFKKIIKSELKSRGKTNK